MHHKGASNVHAFCPLTLKLTSDAFSVGFLDRFEVASHRLLHRYPFSLRRARCGGLRHGQNNLADRLSKSHHVQR